MPRLIGIEKETDQILNDIEQRIKNSVNGSIGSLSHINTTYTGSSVPSSSRPDYVNMNGSNVPITAYGWPAGLQEYIHRCVLHAFEELLSNLYTDKDLERDLNLK